MSDGKLNQVHYLFFLKYHLENLEKNKEKLEQLIDSSCFWQFKEERGREGRRGEWGGEWGGGVKQKKPFLTCQKINACFVGDNMLM